MILQGNDLLIYAGVYVVAKAKTCRISLDADTLECSDATDGNARAFKLEKKGWKVTVTSLVTAAHTRFENLDSIIRLSFVTRDLYDNLTGDRMTGNAFITRSDVTANVGSLVQGTFVFQGTGALERVMDGLRDSDQKDLYDYQGGNRLRAPSSTL